MHSLTDLFSVAESLPVSRLVVAAAQDPASLDAAIEAMKHGWVRLTLVGEKEKITDLLSSRDVDVHDIRIIHAEGLQEAADKSVEQISKGEGDILLKGAVDTGILLKSVLRKEAGLRKAPVLSHLMLYDVPGWDRVIGMTDGGMNLAPDRDKKQAILDNALQAMEALGYKEVKVAIIAAKEKVDPAMPATVDAAEIAASHRGAAHIVEGPLALDLALSSEAARLKGLDSKVAGKADLLLVSTIDVGNVLGKSFTYLGNAQSAGVILGAAIPVLVVSRADSSVSKLYSIALGKVLASQERSHR